MRIELLSSNLEEDYDRFLKKHPHGLFYHSARYKNFLKELLGCQEEYLLAMEGSEIRGVLPLMFATAHGKRVYNSLPYFGSNGGVITDGEQAEKELVAAYDDIASRPSTVSATLISNPFLCRPMMGVVHNYTDDRIGQFTRLAASSDPWNDLMARIDPSARRNVKKATREGIAVEVDHAEMDALRRIHQENMLAIGGTPKPDRFFELVPRHFRPEEDYDIYVARYDGKVIAALLAFYYNRTAEYFTPATDVEHRPLQPLALIIVTAMADAAKRDFSLWNWGGTWLTQTSLYRFKKKWGATESRYAYYIQVNDDSILDWPRDRILKTFPNFFVAPFSALRAGNGRA